MDSGKVRNPNERVNEARGLPTNGVPTRVSKAVSAVAQEVNSGPNLEDNHPNLRTRERKSHFYIRDREHYFSFISDSDSAFSPSCRAPRSDGTRRPKGAAPALAGRALA